MVDIKTSTASTTKKVTPTSSSTTLGTNTYQPVTVGSYLSNPNVGAAGQISRMQKLASNSKPLTSGLKYAANGQPITDQTIWGYNTFGLNPQSSSNANNSLVNTGAVAGIPIQQQQGLMTFEQKENPKPTQIDYYPVSQPKAPATPSKPKATTTQPAPQQPVEQPVEQPTVEPTPEETPAVEIPEAELKPFNPTDDGTGMLYGKNTSDTMLSWEETNDDLTDANSIAMKGRETAYNELQAMPSAEIATMIATGMYGDTQAMRDLMESNPEKYEQVMYYLNQHPGDQYTNAYTYGAETAFNNPEIQAQLMRQSGRNDGTQAEYTEKYDANYMRETFMEQNRVDNLRAMEETPVAVLAQSFLLNPTSFSQDTLRDLKDYNPEYYKALTAEIAKYDTLNKSKETAGLSKGSEASPKVVYDPYKAVKESYATQYGDVKSEYMYTDLMTVSWGGVANDVTIKEATAKKKAIQEEIDALDKKARNSQRIAERAFNMSVPAQYKSAHERMLLWGIEQEKALLEQQLSNHQKDIDDAIKMYQIDQDNYRKQKSYEMQQREFSLKASNQAWGQQMDLMNYDLSLQKLKQGNIKEIDGRFYEIDPTTGTYKELTNSFLWDMQASWSSMFDNTTALSWINADSNGDGFVWCAEWVNSVLRASGMADLQLASTLSGRKDQVNKSVLQDATKGDIAIIDRQGTAKTAEGNKYGHTGFILSDNGNTVTIADWNGTNKGWFGTMTVDKKYVSWYISPVLYNYENNLSSSWASGVNIDPISTPLNPKATEGQAKAAGLAATSYQAVTNLLTQPAADWKGTLIEELADWNWATYQKNKIASKVGLSKDFADIESNVRTILEAYGRKVSGAAISESEWDSFRTMFAPSPMNSDATNAKKIDAMKNLVLIQAQAGGTFADGTPLVNVYSQLMSQLNSGSDYNNW